jgi:hypothetical protein
MRLLSCCLIALVAACGGDDKPPPTPHPCVGTCPIPGPGGDPDITGLYKVDSMTVDNSACGPGMPATTFPAYLQVKEGDLIVSKYYTIASCQSTDTTTCTGFFGIPIYEILTTGGTGYLSSAVQAGSSCTLQEASSTFTVTNDKLRIEQRTYRDGNAATTSCTQQEAHARGATMPCINFQLTMATRVSQ